MNEQLFKEQLQHGIANKPEELIIDDLSWKLLSRCVIKGENVLMVGPSGCAKTMAARLVAKVFDRPFFKFNIGSTQDARATLIGNTSYKKEIGTVFNKSSFITAVTTKRAVILLDELTRGTHDSWNILMSLTDPSQRDLRLDEHDEGSIIKLAEGACLIATANIGNEYTATNVLDKAMSDRFPLKIEMDYLDEDQLKKLFSILFKNASKEQFDILNTLASISDSILSEYRKEDTNISSAISPRKLVKIAELVLDGFTLKEVVELAIYPEYPNDGGADNERVFVKQIVQKYFPVDAVNPVRDVRKKK